MKGALTEPFQPMFKPADYCRLALKEGAPSLEGLL
jgi:hypothetical protein